MTRKQLMLFIIADLFILVFSGHGAWSRYLMLRGEMLALGEEMDPSIERTVAVVSVNTAVDPSGVDPSPSKTGGEKGPGMEENGAPVPGPVEPPATPSPPAPVNPIRKTFSYDSSKAKSVQLVGDFNKWMPQNFDRDPKGRWSLSVPLAPGDYSYSFIVDEKTIRDPYQRRTDAKGRSLLTVK
ncbi:MAG: hypothetical protein IPN19_05125 [Elusimicrobia bacterium]|nr:hypothetical protein [Elusimicrobiota bacterium]